MNRLSDPKGRDSILHDSSQAPDRDDQDFAQTPTPPPSFAPRLAITPLREILGGKILSSLGVHALTFISFATYPPVTSVRCESERRPDGTGRRKVITVHKVAEDRYQRTLERVYICSDEVNTLLVAKGFAWHYKQYSKDETLAELEDKARLWHDPRPVPPWEFRRKDEKKKP